MTLGQRNTTTGVSWISRSKTFSDTYNFVDTTCIPLCSVPWCFGSAVNTLWIMHFKKGILLFLGGRRRRFWRRWICSWWWWVNCILSGLELSRILKKKGLPMLNKLMLLIQHRSVSLAWWLDWEMRRRLILYKTGFTGLRFVIYVLLEQCRVFFRIFTFYLFLNSFSTHVSDNPKYVCGRRLYVCINTRKFKGLDYIIARHQKSDLHRTSFQSSLKINCVLITRPIYIKWNFTTPDHRRFAS